MDLLKNLDVVDTEIQEAINKELSRQRDKLEMIASENIVSKAVMQAQGVYLQINMQKVIQVSVIMAVVNMLML